MVPFQAHAASNHVFLSALLCVTTILAGSYTSRSICHFIRIPAPRTRSQCMLKEPGLNALCVRTGGFLESGSTRQSAGVLKQLR